MEMIKRYKLQRETIEHSAIAKSMNNTAIDNLVAAHTADTAEEQQLDQEQIESAAAAAVVKTIEKAFK